MKRIMLGAVLSCGIIASAPAFKKISPYTAKNIDYLTVADALEAKAHLSHFTYALKSAGVLDKLRKNNTKYTVFAPVDSVFNQINVSENVLKSYMLAGKFALSRAQLASRKTLKTWSGTQRMVTHVNGHLRVDGVRIAHEIKTQNGIIYSIDTNF